MNINQMPPASEAFEFLEKSIRPENGFLIRQSEVQTVAGEVLYGMGEDLLPVLMVPLKLTEPAREDERSRGIQVKTADIPNDPSDGRALMIKCGDPSLRATFSYLVDDICDSLLRSPKTPPGEVAVGVLERWRALLQFKSPEALTESAQVGLIAELHVLERLVAIDGNGLTAWLGPESARNDFLTARASIEVKATLSRDVFAVGIHGIQQLDAPPGKNQLWLYCEQMERYPNGDSIAAIVNRVLAQVSDRAGFLIKLDRLGIRVGDIERYKESYRTVRTRLLPVEAGFPRIVRCTLTDETYADHFTRVEYSIDVGSLPSPVADSDALLEAGHLLA